MDSSEFSTSRIIDWLIQIASLLFAALSWFFDLTPFLPFIDWRWFAIIFTSLFIGYSIYRIIKLENILFSKTPKIVVHSHPHITELPNSEQRWFVFLDTIMEYRVLQISFANKPKRNTELNHAVKLNAQLIYKDVKGNILVGPIYAHWSNPNEPSGKKEALSDELIYDDLDSSGVPKSIYLAILKLPSRTVYAFSNSSYINGFDNPFFELYEDIIDLDIILKGERVNKVFRYRIYNDGKNLSLRIEMR